MANAIRVAILDDHQGIIDGYQYRLGGLSDIEIVGTIRFGEELEPLLSSKPIDVLILDVLVPTSPGNPAPYPILHLIPHLLESHSDLNVLVISAYAQRTLIRAVMEAGASGYLVKEDYAAIANLGSIVRGVANGMIHFSAQAYTAVGKRPSANEEGELTSRQQEVLSACAAYPDAKTADLARRLGIAHSSLRNLLSEVYVRLGVRSRTAAVDKARRLGLITPLAPEIRLEDLDPRREPQLSKTAR